MKSTFGLKLMNGDVIQEREVQVSDDTEAAPPPETPEAEEPGDEGDVSDNAPPESIPDADKKPVPYDRFHKKVEQNRVLFAELQKAREDLNSVRLESANRTNEVLARMSERSQTTAQPPVKTDLDKAIEGLAEDQPELASALTALKAQNEGLRREVAATKARADSTHDQTRSIASERFADNMRVTIEAEMGGDEKLNTPRVHDLIAKGIAGYIASADQRTFKPEHAIAEGKRLVGELRELMGIKKTAVKPTERSARERAPRAPAVPGGTPGAGNKSARMDAIDLIRSVQSGMK